MDSKSKWIEYDNGGCPHGIALMCPDCARVYVGTSDTEQQIDPADTREPSGYWSRHEDEATCYVCAAGGVVTEYRESEAAR